MEMRNYEVRGYYYETESGGEMKVDFVCFVPPCPNSYVAKQYVIGKLSKYNAFIESITRVLE